MLFRASLLLLFCLVFVVRSDPTSVVLGCESDSRIDVEETLVDSPIVEVSWLGGSSGLEQFVFVRSRNKVVYRSENAGKTWTDESLKLKTAKGTQGNRNTRFGINEVVVSSAGDHIWFIGNGNDTWVTADKGATYAFRDIGMSFISLKPHPTMASWALAQAATEACTNRLDPRDCFLTLYLTKDLGATWQTIQTYTGAFFWGANDKIWAEVWPKGGDQQFWARWDVSLQSSSDSGATWSTVMSHVAGSLMKYETLFVAQFTRQNGPLKLYSSRNLGEKDLVMAKLPFELDETRYTILDTTDDFQFISVEQEDPKWGNVYESDNEESNFVLSLAMNSRDIYGHVEFTKVEGLSGIYIANVYKDSLAVRDNRTYSVITFNNGGKWTPLKPPKTDADGKPIFCRENDKTCVLNLYGGHKTNANGNQDLTDFGPLHTRENAIGLVMGTGNVGKYMDDDEVNTYFSRDAGHTWAEVRKGSHVYEFGNMGGVVVMAKNKEETNTILYSFNMGDSWNECKFTDNSALEVLDITSEPLNIARTFFLHGTRQVGDGTVGVLVHLDFEAIHPRPCNETDYEFWSPSDLFGESCLLGEKVTYSRKKKDSDCANPRTYEPKQTLGVCKCTQDDYECDYCFEPYQGDGYTCVYTCPDKASAGKPPEDCKDYYEVSQGYRKVDGTKCEGGLDLNPTRVPCPKVETPQSLGSKGLAAQVVVVIVILVSALVFILVAGCLILFSKNEGFQRLVRSGYGRLPSSIRDPFRGTSFIRIDNLDDEDPLGLTEEETGLKELDEQNLADTIKHFKDNKL